MPHIKDYNDFFNDHEDEQERKTRRFPVCVDCDEVILDEECYEFDGDLICEDCLCKYHKKRTEDKLLW